MKNQRILPCILAAILAVALDACGPLEFEEYPDETGGTGGKGGTAVNASDRLTADYENALPVETQLILGTLLLEETDQAVDAKQAAALLPLWQQWHDLNRSQAAAPGDRDALLARIQSAMTEAQIQAIAAMELTQQEMLAYIEKYGAGFSSGSTGTPPAPSSDGDADDTPAPDIGNFPGVDQTQTLSPDELATLQSVYQGGYGGSHRPEWGLLHALIYLLEAKQAA